MYTAMPKKKHRPRPQRRGPARSGLRSVASTERSPASRAPMKATAGRSRANASRSNPARSFTAHHYTRVPGSAPRAARPAPPRFNSPRTAPAPPPPAAPPAPLCRLSRISERKNRVDHQDPAYTTHGETAVWRRQHHPAVPAPFRSNSVTLPRSTGTKYDAPPNSPPPPQRTEHRGTPDKNPAPARRVLTRQHLLAPNEMIM
jgi:hypothetical protein